MPDRRHSLTRMEDTQKITTGKGMTPDSVSQRQARIASPVYSAVLNKQQESQMLGWIIKALNGRLRNYFHVLNIKK